MIKFAALNATAETPKDVAPTTASKEVIESDAITKYRSALLLIKNKSNTKAEEALKELLLHPYFSFDDETFSGPDFFNDPAVKLLTCIYKNLGKVHETVGNYDDALECYMEAVSSDKSDITTWYNIANVAIHKVSYEVACTALKECLNLNASFWPCIDTLICVLYALGDYLSCLHLIQHALALNKEFDRALCVKEQIKKEDPFLFKNFAWKDDFMDLQPDSSKVVQELKYPFTLKERDRQAKKSAKSNEITPTLKLRQISLENPLSDLGNAITELYHQVKKENISLFSPVDFSTSNIDELLASVSTAPAEEPKSSDDTAAVNGEKSVEVGGMVIAGPSDAEPGVTRAVDKPDVTPLIKPVVEPMEVTEKDKEVKEKEAKEKDAKEAKELKELKELVRREGSRRSRRVQEQMEEEKETAPVVTLQQELERCMPTCLIGIEDNKNAEIGDLCNKSDVPETTNSTKIDSLDVPSLIAEILSDRQISLIPLMKLFCNKLSAQYSKLWSRDITKAFLKVYLSYREYEALPNILQNFQSESTESNVLTLMFAFEIIVDNDLFPEAACNEPFFKDACLSITKASLVNDQEFLRTASTHDGIKQMFASELLYESFQVRYAWAYCLYEQKLSNTECAVELIKLCLSTLEESELENVITANVKNQVITNEVLENHKKVLSDVLSRDNVTALFKEKDYVRVVDILLPILNENQANLDINDESRLPTRHKNLLILLESLKKLDKFQDCLKCCELLLTELVPFARFTDTWTELFKKIFKALTSCLQNMKSDHISLLKLKTILKDLIKLIVSYYDAVSCADSKEESIFLNVNFKDFPIERAWITYHMIIGRCLDSQDPSSDPEKMFYQHKLDPLLLAHEWLGKYSHCTNANGIFLIHTLECCLVYKNEEDLFSDDLTNLFEQALFCLIGHPGAGSKRSKKNRVSHNTSPLPLRNEFSYLAYSYYVPEQMFDPGEKGKHISADTYDLFQKIALSLENIISTETFLKIKLFLEKGSISSYKAITMSESQSKFEDIYYLCGDYLMKYEDFTQAIEWYVCDLCIHPSRMISWLSLGKCWLTIAEDRFNHAESDLKYVIESMAPKALLCFDYFFTKAPPVFSILSEYACFVYTIASAYSQILRSIDDDENALSIQKERVSLITKAKEKYELASEPEKEDGWVRNYMMGKVEEKLAPVELKWLDHYMKAFKNLEDYVPTLLKKINYNSPTDYSMECLELCFRVAYSVYKRSFKHPEIANNAKVEESLGEIAKLMGIKTEEYELSSVYKEKPYAKLVMQILEECLAKFPEHYKMRNALVNIYLKTDDSAEWAKAKNIMFQDPNNSGLFSLSKKHLFYGIWRIPVDAVDRPGSFFRHMQKALLLLIQTLTKCQDIENLIKLFEFMVRTVDQLNVYVIDVAQFLQHCVTTVDVLLTKHVSEYCNSPESVNHQQSVQYLKLAQKAKNAHLKASLPTKPIDAISMVILKHLKLSVPQQMALIDPKCLANPWRLHDIVNQVLNEYAQTEKNVRIYEAARQRMTSMEQQNNALKEAQNALKDAQRIQIPLSGANANGKTPEPSVSSSSAIGQKIPVKDKAIGQAITIASFMAQMAENQQGRNDTKDVTNFLQKLLTNQISQQQSNLTPAKLADAIIAKANANKALEISTGASSQKQTGTNVQSAKSPLNKSPSGKSSIHVIKTSIENKIKEQESAIAHIQSPTPTASNQASGSVKIVTAMSLKKAIPRLHQKISVLAKNNKLLQKNDLNQSQNSAVSVRLKDKSPNTSRVPTPEVQSPVTPEKELLVISCSPDKKEESEPKMPEPINVSEFEARKNTSQSPKASEAEVGPKVKLTKAIVAPVESRPKQNASQTVVQSILKQKTREENLQELLKKIAPSASKQPKQNLAKVNLNTVSLERSKKKSAEYPLPKPINKPQEKKAPDPISFPKPVEFAMPSPVNKMPSPINIMPSFGHLITQSKANEPSASVTLAPRTPVSITPSTSAPTTPTVSPTLPSITATPTVKSSPNMTPNFTVNTRPAEALLLEKGKDVNPAPQVDPSSFLSQPPAPTSLSNIIMPSSINQPTVAPRTVVQAPISNMPMKHNSISRSMSLNCQPNIDNNSNRYPPLMRSNSTNEGMIRQHSSQDPRVSPVGNNLERRFDRHLSSSPVRSKPASQDIASRGLNFNDVSPTSLNKDQRMNSLLKSPVLASNLSQPPDQKPKVVIKTEACNDSESDEDDMPSLESGVSAIETKGSNPGIKSGTQKALETHLNNRKMPDFSMPKMPGLLNYNPADGSTLPQPPLLTKKEDHGYPQPPQLSSPLLQSPPPMHNFKQYPQFGENDKSPNQLSLVSSSPSSLTPTSCISGGGPGNMKLDLSKQFVLAPIDGQCGKDPNSPLDSPGILHGINKATMMGSPNTLPNAHLNQSYILPKSNAKSPAILTLHPVSQTGAASNSYFNNLPGVQGPHNIKKIKQPKPPKEKITKEERARRKREKELLKLEKQEKKNNKRRKVSTPSADTKLDQFDFPTLDGNQPKSPFLNPSGMPPDSLRLHGPDGRLGTMPNQMSPMMPGAMTSPFNKGSPDFQRPGMSPMAGSVPGNNFGVFDQQGTRQPGPPPRQQFPGHQMNNNPNGDEVYQADDFFAGAKPTPPPQASEMMKGLGYNPMSGPRPEAPNRLSEIAQRSNMMGMSEMMHPNQMVGGQQIKRENEEGFVEPDLDNIDLGILDELDCIDMTEEKLQPPPQPAAPVKAKRGRKPKDPSLKAVPKRKKTKAAAAKAAQADAAATFPHHLPQSPSFNLPNQSRFPYPCPAPGMPGFPAQQTAPGKPYFYPPTTLTGGPTPRPWYGAANQASPTTSNFPMQGSLQPHTVQHPTQLDITPAQLPPTSPLTSPVGGQFQAFSPNHSYNSNISSSTTPSPGAPLYQQTATHFNAPTTQHSMTPTKTTPSPLKAMYKAATPTNYAPSNYISSEQGSTPFHPAAYTTSSIMQSPSSASLGTPDPLARSENTPAPASVGELSYSNTISPTKLSPTTAGVNCKRSDQFAMPSVQGYNDTFHNRVQPPKNPHQQPGYGDMSPQFSAHNPQFPTSMYPDHRSTFISQPPASAPPGPPPTLGGPPAQPPIGQFQTFPGAPDESRQYVNQTMNQHYSQQNWPTYGNF